MVLLMNMTEVRIYKNIAYYYYLYYLCVLRVPHVFQM